MAHILTAEIYSKNNQTLARLSSRKEEGVLRGHHVDVPIIESQEGWIICEIIEYLNVELNIDVIQVVNVFPKSIRFLVKFQ